MEVDMSLLELPSLNIGREYNENDVQNLIDLIAAPGQLPGITEYHIGSVLGVILLLDIATGRLPASSGARTFAAEQLQLPVSFLPG